MRRVSADLFYLFSDDYFADLRLVLGDRLHLCTLLSPGNELAAAGLFTVNNRVAQAYLAGTVEKYLRVAPSKPMIYSEMLWAKENGPDVLHLGGGVGGKKDYLFQFKSGFLKLRSDFYTYRMILNERRYSLLVDLWKSQQSGTAQNNSDWFPQYRN
jgi:lipid II:glycine glycyltransferase (peptidoglycan interpeptide bridge formation enzyme)